MKKIIVTALLCASGSIVFAQEAKLTDTVSLQPVEISSVKATELAPFAKTNLTAKEISKSNTGQDMPYLLDQTPSVVVNSDAGTGIGYTGIHIRGSDATRINVTLNGIPYNDAESEGTYWVDIPDMASSISSIQIQRGVGTSSNGTGAFGATIALTTNEFNKVAYGDINSSYGSFNSFKNTVKAGSGLIDGHFTIDARMSMITSDGYIDRASSNLKSFALSAAYLTKQSSFRFNVFSGKEKTYQAWDGVPQDSLATNRTYNDLGTEKPGTPYNNQTDNYQQDHYQLFFDHTFNDRWSFNTAVFMTYGRGYYQEYKGDSAELAKGDNSETSYAYYGLPNPVVGNDTITNSDLVRQLWLDNHYYGQIASAQYKTQKDILTIGGSWTVYQGSHFGNVIWAQKGGLPTDDYQYYNHPVLKTDDNIYAKWQHTLSANWTSFVDVQYRTVYHRIDGFEAVSVSDPSDSLRVARTFNFVNPKAGITYSKNGWQAYASYARANKEPNYSDFQANPTNQPKAETLNDFELGLEKNSNKYTWGANLYYMQYIDQLILTGQINSVGAYTRVNVPKSYRLGLELQGTAILAKWLNISANATFSINKIKAFAEFLDVYDSTYTWTGQKEIDHTNTNISFSPAEIIGGIVNFIPVKNSQVSFISKYVGRQYMDNTSDLNRSLAGYFTESARLSYTIQNKFAKQIDIILQVNNLLSTKYNTNGYTYADIESGSVITYNNYFPMALINYMIGVNMHF
ncbi:MAG TPA: TonB-dependent receptor [Ferruginibacter sp.]|nr:TonB-dependent receptor [Ferruginibacter sp.]